MNKHERRKVILDMLNKHGVLDVQQLSEKLQVSSVTIRTDLSDMQRNGLVVRCHGGVMKPEDTLIPIMKQHFNASYVNKSKIVIADKALNRIEDNMTISIGSGTTNAVLAEKISLSKIKGLTVVTNNLFAINFLSQNQDITLIVIGGKYIRNNHSTFKADISDILDFIKIDITFTGADGLDETGVTSKHEGFSMSSELSKSAKRTIVLTESFKLGKRFFNHVVNKDEIEEVITEK